MKKSLLKLLTLVLTLIMALSFASCYSSQGEQQKTQDKQKETESETYVYRFNNIPRGAQLPMTGDYVEISADFTPSKKTNGYVSSANISVNVKGFDKELTYFNAVVIVTWTYNEITEENPGGINRKISATVTLDADGIGSHTQQISFTGCRDVQLVDIDYEWSGQATKK